MADNEKEPAEFAYGAVFVVMFLPPLAFLAFQIYRAVKYLQNRDAMHKFFWLKFRTFEHRLNIHLILKLSFGGICSVRIFQGLLFIFELLVSTSEQKHPGIDNVVRYYIPYIAINAMFTCVSILLYYWLELGLAAAMEIGNQPFIPRKVTWGIVAMNVVVHLATIIALIALIRPENENAQIQTEGRAKTFQIFYFFAISVPMMLSSGAGNIWVRYTMKRIQKKLDTEKQVELQPHIMKAYHKMGWFVLAVVIAFAVRVFFDFIIIFIDMEEERAALLSFLWNSLPELGLTIALILLTWIKKSKLKPSNEERDTLLSDTLAPEVDLE